jgi:WD40 repeat protein
LKFIKQFKTVSRVLLLFIVITFFILPMLSVLLLSSPSGNVFSTSGSEIDIIILEEEDINSMGVKWKYHRPDGGPEENSTNWKLRWSPDGSMIAVVYFDNTTVILDGNTGKLIKALGTSASKLTDNVSGSRCWGWTSIPTAAIIRACAWSPDGDLLAIAGDHRLIEIYNTTTWERERVLSGHDGSILSLDWSPDGTRIASGEGTDQVLPHYIEENKNNIKIWDVTTGKELMTLSGHEDSVMSLSWSANSTLLASASDDRNLKLWDTTTGTVIYTLGEGIGHSAGVLDVDWSPNQTLLVSGSRDFKIRLWDARLGTPLGKAWKDHNCVRSTHWHPTGKYIATAGVDQTLKIRDAKTGDVIKTFIEAEDSNSEVMSARWSPDGSAVVACSTRDATVRLYTMGFDTSSTEVSDWRAGASIFFIIVICGLILLYLPLKAEFHKRRK